MAGVTVYLNKAGIKKDAGQRLKRAQIALDQQIAKDSNYYAPEDKGDLKDSVYLGSVMGSGLLTWAVEKARRLYHGIGFNFSKDKNPNARAEWFEWAKKIRMNEWVKVANSEYRK
jgi:hypothetical protein